MMMMMRINEIPIHTKYLVRIFADNTVVFIRNQNINKLKRICSAFKFNVTIKPNNQKIWLFLS